jgi:transposase InsO family protein
MGDGDTSADRARPAGARHGDHPAPAARRDPPLRSRQQYTSVAFGRRCREMGVRVGDAYDNAMCESFFATLECELLDRHRFKTQVEVRLAVFEFIEGWYNPHRRHSALDYQSPLNYERSQALAS